MFTAFSKLKPKTSLVSGTCFCCHFTQCFHSKRFDNKKEGLNIVHTGDRMALKLEYPNFFIKISYTYKKSLSEKTHSIIQ